MVSLRTEALDEEARRRGECVRVQFSRQSLQRENTRRMRIYLSFISGKSNADKRSRFLEMFLSLLNLFSWSCDLPGGFNLNNDESVIGYFQTEFAGQMFHIQLFICALVMIHYQNIICVAVRFRQFTARPSTHG